MKAMLLDAYGEPEALGIHEVPTPEPGAGEVLIRVRAVTVNRTRDRDIVAGRGGKPEFLPLVPGLDPAGEIAAVGEGATGFAPGDRVVALSRICCDICEDCRDGRDGDCRFATQLGMTRWGGYAEYVAAPVENVFPIAERLSFAEAAVILRHYPTAFQLLEEKAGLKPGQWVLVMGAAGGLGSCGVQAAKSMGATVIAGAGADERVAVGLEVGADHGVNYRTGNLTEQVMRITDGRGVDVVFENISDPTTWTDAFNCLAYYGVLVTAGAHGGGNVCFDAKRLYQNRLRIHGGAGAGRANVARALEGAAAGALTAVVEQILPLGDLHRAWDLIGTGAVRGKIVIDPSL